ncbi:extracellular solute-binding protein [Oleidesulfovibrio sp.]|uniref:extracellular solute-binding protein n=1 Tax=Oleidesulfovibrio sp. TaxID=2909707 RepID=UPI003A83B5D0
MKNKLMLFVATMLLFVAQTALAFDGAELYPGEKALYEKAAEEGMVVSFDTGPTWANWGTMFKRFKARYPEVEMAYNDLGSGATVVALEKARRRPQADTAYYFGASAIDAANKGLLTGFEPVNYEKLPDVYRDKEGRWFIVHQLTIAFLVNKKLVNTVPQSWADLKKPEYKNAIVYLDPRSTGQGQVLSFAANYGNGGDMSSVLPGMEYLAELHKAGNVMRVEGTTPYAKFLKGEIPIWIGYENDGLKAKYKDGMGDDIAVVIPREATVAAPYAISMVKDGPNPNAARLWLNFIMTDAGQTTFAEGFVRPSVPGIKLPADIAERFPETPQLRPLDLHKAAGLKSEIDSAWTRLVLGK